MDTPRYGIYYAPPLDGPLWKAGSAWLGRDAVTGDHVRPPDVPGLDGVDHERLTAGPRHYGFHATMKAPFELAAGQSEDALLKAVSDFAAGETPFDVPLSVHALGHFIALRPDAPSPPLTALHEGCVRTFEPFRAPLAASDIARRRKANLTREQDKRMLEWGYPYIFDDFRFHMTLTGRVPNDALRGTICDALSRHFSELLSAPHTFSGIAVYKQLDRDAPFNVVERFVFGSPAGG